jgi:hypothetical protein
VLLGLAADVHPNAIAFVPLFGFAYLRTTDDGSRRPWRPFATGVAVGLAVYALSRVAPDPGGFVQSFGFWVGVEKRPPKQDGQPLNALGGELGRLTDSLAGRPLELLTLGAGLGWAAWRALRGSRAHAMVLAGLFGAFTVFSALVASKVPFYLILYYPLLCALVGSAVADACRSLPARLVVGATAVALLALMGFGLLDYARDLAYRAARSDHDYGLLTRQLRGVVPQDAVVVGQPVYWPALTDRRFVDLDVAERLRRERGVGLERFLRDSGATVVLIDDDTRGRLPSADRAWLSRASDKVLVIEQKYYGTVDVRRLRAPG